MLVQIPDHVVLPYQEYADKTGRTLNGVLSAQLERFQSLPPGKRCIVLDIAAAEAILKGLPIMGEADLLHRIQQLASICFGPVKLDLTIGQLKELEHRAARQGRKVEDLVKETADLILRDLFWVSGGGPAKAPQVPPAGPSVPASTAGVCPVVGSPAEVPPCPLPPDSRSRTTSPTILPSATRPTGTPNSATRPRNWPISSRT